MGSAPQQEQHKTKAIPSTRARVLSLVSMKNCFFVPSHRLLQRRHNSFIVLLPQDCLQCGGDDACSESTKLKEGWEEGWIRRGE